MNDTATVKHRLEGLLEELEPALEEESRPLVEDFARRLMSRASTEFLESHSSSWLASQVRAAFELVQGTPPDDISVRVRDLPGDTGEFVVQTVMTDRAFIVDTVREHLHSEGYSIVQLLHPVLRVSRDDAGRIRAVEDREGEGARTSVIFILAEGRPDEEQRDRLHEELRARLEKVRMATDDFDLMLEASHDVSGDLGEMCEWFPWRTAELEEMQSFLEWLRDDNFVFLGYREYEVRSGEGGEKRVGVRPGSGLGILRDESDSRYAEPVPVDDLDPDLQARLLGGPLLIFSKTNAISPVHRNARMDYVGVKRMAPNGEVKGERRFLGLLTAQAYSQDASQIPILRRKLEDILEAEGATRGSHDYSLIHRIFNSMPKEELFLSPVPELLAVVNTVMQTEGADEVRVTARADSLGRGVNVMVILPSSKFSAEIRRKIQDELVQTYRGELLNYHFSMGGGDQARLHFYLSSGLDEVEKVDVEALEERVRRSARSWQERLTDALERSHEPGRARELMERHRGEFSAEYVATMDPSTAVMDIAQLEALEETGVQQTVMETLDPERPGAFRLKIFVPRGLFVLSDVMPTLENLGFRVLEADKYEVGKPGRMPATIHTFDVETPLAWQVERSVAEPRVAAALRAIQGGRTEDDPLNALVLSAGLDWWQVALLRAYANYALRLGAVTSRVGVRRPLTTYPRCSRLLFEIFEALHDPALDDADREIAVSDLRSELEEALDDVRGVDDDRTLRKLLHLVEGTARTNFYQDRARERESGMISLKIDCDCVDFLPRPRPRYEVYVNSANTEGAHLRMGTVARGGIRWSDRVEDFRVEVLGLAKTQQVKNSVIVPSGAKGAYVVKDLPGEREARQAAGEASYREFIRGLLDVTDNIRDEEVVHPPQTVIRDGEDPYLVVAADKGTAHLSDTANRLARDYDFWLDDAFASGGSRGYDHKKLGITARGAWECVERHFRELGRDIEEEPFSVVGIGDMGGDVFGNGMLLSEKIRLLGAFDHRHVFVDPDPDPGESHQERMRLYEADGSTWMDYDEEVLSEGGGVWDRDAKNIDLPDEAREALGIEREGPLTGGELIRAILRAPVDLLWNGGIGTYVKASGESDADVEDPANDDVRVDAERLRAKIVGEGGNLGFTQRARVEYASRGGRINTDALDNSAGVDMSDHEVNLKILLNGLVREGELSMDRRNELLRDVEEEVADQVLRDNYLQSLAVTLERHRARQRPGEFRETLVQLEAEAGLDRELEALPTADELTDRLENGQHLTRPELCVIMAYAKLELKDRLAASELTSEPALRELLFDYFPDRVVACTGREEIDDHRLAGRIVATSLTNRFVNRMGGTSHVRLAREMGEPFPRIARAWFAAHRIADAEPLYAALEGVDGEVRAGVQSQWFLQVAEDLEAGTRWILSNAPADATTGELAERYGEPVAELRGELDDLLTEGRRVELENRRELHETDGLDAGAAADLATLRHLDGLLPVAELARSRDLSPVRVGRVYFGLGRDVDFPWLQSQLDRVGGGRLWDQRAAKTLSLQLDAARMRITRDVLDEAADDGDVEGALESFRAEHADELRRIRDVIDDVREEESPGLPALMVAVNAIAS